jgi:spermidine synthase
MLLSVACGMLFVIQWRDRGSVPILDSSRNFYGTMKVFDYYPYDDVDNYHLLLHGATTHGLQFTNPERSMIATTYYPGSSGIGMALNNMSPEPRRIGLVGLGTGTLAVYGREGDYLRIYEINPDVERVARTYFTHIDKTPAKVDLALGDARLVMEREIANGGSQQFDILALDAFSSDAIPVHLLTKEAFEIYLKQIKPNGIIAVHISNRYLDLRPVVEKLAEHFGMDVVSISDDNEPEWWIYATTWMILSKDKKFMSTPAIMDAADAPEPQTKTTQLWTDDFTNLYSILK